MLKLDKLQVFLRGQPLFAPLTLSIQPGEVVTLMGPSGCGKSSLLKLLSGTLTAPFTWQGSASLAGRALLTLPAWQRRLGILFQDDLLFPHLSVAENIAFGLPPSLRGAQRRARVEALLSAAELAGFAKRDPASLSGGQRARVALYRALAAEPLALLLDEPFAALDQELRQRQRALVFAQAKALPVLLVTHDAADAGGGPVIALARRQSAAQTS